MWFSNNVYVFFFRQYWCRYRLPIAIAMIVAAIGRSTDERTGRTLRQRWVYDKCYPDTLYGTKSDKEYLRKITNVRINWHHFEIRKDFHLSVFRGIFLNLIWSIVNHFECTSEIMISLSIVSSFRSEFKMCIVFCLRISYQEKYFKL